MPPIGFAGIWRGRMHYAWIVLAVMFSATLAGVGVRAAPGVMIVPLQRAFGWDVATVSGAISLNIILLGATGPFLTGLIEVIGLKRTILACMAMLIAGTGLSNLMTAPWQMFLTWGLMVGIGLRRWQEYDFAPHSLSSGPPMLNIIYNGNGIFFDKAYGDVSGLTLLANPA